MVKKLNFFKNKKLENLPNIFGKQKNFLNIYLHLINEFSNF